MIVALLLASVMTASASLRDVNLCLEKYDIPCAERGLEAISADQSSDPNVLAMIARVHFFSGRYPEAYDTLEKAVDGGWEDKWKVLALYQRTMFVTANWTEVHKDRFRVRYKPGTERDLS